MLAHRGLDSFEYRRRAKHELRKLIAFDGIAWWTTDPSTGFFTSGISDPEPEDPDLVFCRLLHANEFIDPDYTKFRVVARRATHTGVLSEATRGLPERSDRYRRMLQPIGFAHELRLALVDGSNCWGALMLIRAPDAPDFSAQDKRVAATLVETLAGGCASGSCWELSPPAGCMTAQA